MHIIRLTTALLLTAALGAAPAQATTRYAATGGQGAQCDAASPCGLGMAVNGAAAGDTVVVAPGDYTIATPLSADHVDVRGAADGARPRIVGTTGINGAVLTANGGTVAHVAVQATGTRWGAITAKGASLEDVMALARGSNAAVELKGTATFGGLVRSSVVRCDGCPDGAVVIKDSEAVDGTVDLVNVTILAAGTALNSSATLVTPVLVDVAASGGGQDIIATAARPAQVSFSAFRPAASTNVAAGAGNVGPAVFVVGNDPHPAATSPTIDAGTADPRSLPFDVDGTARPFGDSTDIGAYEFTGTKLMPPAQDALVGGSGGGSPTTGTDVRAAAVLPPAGAPVAGKVVAVTPAAGRVLVRLPDGSFAPLADGRQIKVGTEVDVTRGQVRLTSAVDGDGTPQTGVFSGGRFTVRQTTGPHPVTQLVLTGGGAFSRCPRPGARARIARRAPKRRLWGSDHGGRFQTIGRAGSATVRGTRWLTVDTCRGTRVKVAQGAVSVHDNARDRNVLVRAGHAYLARAAR